jgi:tetratricopeptide (TPR) repeat protein
MGCLHGNLDKAQTRLDRVLTLAKTDDRAFYRYWALLGLGDIRMRRGDRAGALKSYNDGGAIADRLAKSDPGNAGWQRDLSVRYQKIGDVQKAQGDLAAARKSYSEGLAIAYRPSMSDRDNTHWQSDLSVWYEKVGDVQMDQGDLDDALKSYQNSLNIAYRLATTDRGNAEWQRDLSAAYGQGRPTNAPGRPSRRSEIL